MTTPKLHFGDTEDETGKPPILSQFKSERPAIFIRELIQNALDARLALDNQTDDKKPCCIRFLQKEIYTSDVPGIKEYKESLKLAKEYHKEDQSTLDYIENLENQINSKKIKVLLVYDNGIGFNKKRLKAVLGDGSSIKSTTSTGSFGTGHLTAFAISKIQYIFYAGKSIEGDYLSAGHAITAGHENPIGGKLKSHNGYYLVDNIRNEERFKGYVSNKNDIPDFLAVDSLGDSGSLVGILGFDLDKIKEDSDQTLKDIVFKIAIENFAVAINSNDLKISVGEELSQTNLQKNLNNFFSENHNKKKERKLIKVQNVLNTINNDNITNGKLEKPFEDCEILIKEDKNYTDISIWRNGMLVTVNEFRPLSSGRFEDKYNFIAVILLSGKNNPSTAHDLIRAAEPPLHDRLDTRVIDDNNKRKQFNKLISSIRAWINKHTKTMVGDETYLREINIYEVIETDKPTPIPVPDPEPEPPEPVPPGPYPPGPVPPGPGPGPYPPGPLPDPPIPPGPPRQPRHSKEPNTPGFGRFRGEIYCLRIFPTKNIKIGILHIYPQSGSQDPSADKNVFFDKLTVSKVLKSDHEVQLTSNGIEIYNIVAGKAINLEIKFNEPIEIIKNMSLRCILVKKD